MLKKSIGIYGLGLLGASLALAVKKNYPDIKVVGLGRDNEKLEKAKKTGIIDIATDNSIDIIKELDYFFICTPSENVANIFGKYISMLSDEVIVMDVSSVKRVVIEEVKKINYRNLCFVGTHPMTGSEKSGMEYAREDLFDNKIVAVMDNHPENILEEIKNFWKKLGAQTVLISPDFHDEITAETSHLPHLLSSVLCNTLSKDGWADVRFFGLYGKGLLDVTRIAMGKPEMWADIFISNYDNLERFISDFQKELECIKKFIQNNDKQKIINYLKEAKLFREKL